MSSAKTVVKNTIFLFTSDVIGRIFSFLLIILIARKLGDFGLGEYSFAFSFVGLFSILADMGISTYLIREIAKDKKNMQTYFLHAFSLKLFLCFITFFIPAIMILFFGKSHETVVIVWMASLALFFGNFSLLFKAVFQGYEHMGYYALIDLTERTITFLLGTTLLFLGYGIFSLFTVFIVSYSIAFLLALFILLKKYTSVRFVFNFSKWVKLLKVSMPFWLTMLFMSVYFNIGTIILSKYTDFSVVGWYNAANKIIYALFFIPLVLTAVIFPTLSKFYVHQKQLQKLLFQKSFYYMVVITVPLLVGGLFLAEKLILLVYGPEFTNSIIALKILLFSLVFIFVNYLIGFLLNSINKQTNFMWTTLFSSVVNVGLNLILIPRYSYVGASFAVVITELLNFIILYSFITKYKFSLSLPALFIKPLFSALVMLALLYFTRDLHVIVSIVLGGVVYFSVLYLLKGISQDEILVMKSLLKRK